MFSHKFVIQQILRKTEKFPLLPLKNANPHINGHKVLNKNDLLRLHH
jgi:hypothetical protein